MLQDIYFCTRFRKRTNKYSALLKALKDMLHQSSTCQKKEKELRIKNRHCDNNNDEQINQLSVGIS